MDLIPVKFDETGYFIAYNNDRFYYSTNFAITWHLIKPIYTFEDMQEYHDLEKIHLNWLKKEIERLKNKSSLDMRLK